MKPGPEHVGMLFRTGPYSGKARFLALHEDGGVTMAFHLRNGLGQPFKVPPGRFDSDGWAPASEHSEKTHDGFVPAFLSRLLAAGFDQAEFGLMATKDPAQSSPLVWRFRGCVYGINEWIAYDWVGGEPDMGRIEEDVMGRLREKLDAAKKP